MLLITPLFFIAALIYSAIGFGGGSTYTALLSLSDISFEILPTIALLCNCVVVSGNVLRYYKYNLIEWKLITPFLITSIPSSFIGGLFRISEDTFLLILGVCLFLAGISLFLDKLLKHSYKPKTTTPPFFLAITLGVILGLISGITGIGGGIYLAPLLYFLRWGEAKHIASCASIFIFMNSIFGITGQMIKNGIGNFEIEYSLLILAVLLGGQLGNHVSTKYFSSSILQTLTSCLIIVASIIVLNRSFNF